MTPVSKTQNSIAATIAIIIAAIVILRIGKRFVPVIPFTVLMALVILCIFCVIVYTGIKKGKPMDNQVNSASGLAFWQAVTRYFIAMDMVMFGLQKIFHLQFSLPLGVLDNPFSSLSGEQLIWAFFGKFYSFTVIIASLQISSAIMLLFSKTRLLGILVLLPILCNILLLDWFYDLGITVNLYITLLTIALIYLLLAEYPRLKEFFLIAKSNIPSVALKSKWEKNGIRASAVIIPMILMSFYRFPHKFPEIFGKYEVENNFTTPSPNGCDTRLTKIFIDENDLVFEFDNYQNRWIGHYNYNVNDKQIKVIWRYPANQHDTLSVKMDVKQNGVKTLTGHIGKKKLTIDMQKIN